MKATRLPVKHRLPFDYPIKIKPTSKAYLESMYGLGVQAVWLKESKTILYLKDLSPARKRYLIAHELQHAVLDFIDDGLQTGVMAV